jgi:hypothetical protein
MAITSALSVVVSSVSSGQPARFVLVVSNDGGADVTLTGVKPYTSAAGLSGDLGAPVKLGATTWTVPAAGSLTLSWQGVLFASRRPAGRSTRYDVTVRVEEADSTTVSNTVAIIVTPSSPDSLPAPLVGQTRFDLNLNSHLLALL